MIVDRTRILVSIAILVASLGVYYVLSRPMKAEYNRLMVEYVTKKQEVEKARTLAKNYERLKARKDSLEAIFREQLELLPEEEDLPGLLDEIIANGRRAGIEFLLFQPQPRVAKDFYDEVPIQVEVRGTYHQLGRFLTYLAYARRLLNVRNMTITREEIPGAPYTIRAKFMVIAYVYKGKHSTPTTTAQKG